MQKIILRANVPYTDPDEMKKKRSSGALGHYAKKEQRYSQSIIFAALLTLLVIWVFYMTQSVFGLHLFGFSSDNPMNVYFMLVVFILLWLIFSIFGFVQVLLSKEKLDEIMVSPSYMQANIIVKLGNWYFIIAFLLCGVLGLLDHIKSHSVQPISLGMAVILAIVCFWPYFRSRILALPLCKKIARQLISTSRRIHRTKGVETSFATLTKYYPSTKRNSSEIVDAEKRDHSR